MRVEAILNEVNLIRLRVLLCLLFHKDGLLTLGALRLNLCQPFSDLRFNGHQQVT
jgi:hypothetical protein